LGEKVQVFGGLVNNYDIGVKKLYR